MPETIYRMEVEPLDLGPDVPAVSLDLLDPESAEPLTGAEAARIWAAALPAIAATEPWTLDFFAHRDRVTDFCLRHGIACREAGASVLAVAHPAAEPLQMLFERFAGETIGARAGKLAVSGDPGVEGNLARQGVDAYHSAFPGYLFCAVCDFENGSLTLLTKSLWASEVIRRLRSVLTAFRVDVARPAP